MLYTGFRLHRVQEKTVHIRLHLSVSDPALTSRMLSKGSSTPIEISISTQIWPRGSPQSLLIELYENFDITILLQGKIISPSSFMERTMLSRYHPWFPNAKLRNCPFILTVFVWFVQAIPEVKDSSLTSQGRLIMTICQFSEVFAGMVSTHICLACSKQLCCYCLRTLMVLLSNYITTLSILLFEAWTLSFSLYPTMRLKTL